MEIEMENISVCAPEDFKIETYWRQAVPTFMCE